MEGECNKESRVCPFCEADIAEAAFPYCEACKVEVFTCPKCHKVVPRDKKKCPHCGAAMKA